MKSLIPHGKIDLDSGRKKLCLLYEIVAMRRAVMITLGAGAYADYYMAGAIVHNTFSHYVAILINKAPHTDFPWVSSIKPKPI